MAGDPEPDVLAIAFGRRLAGLREASGLTQPELGERTGMKKAYIWRVEQGRTLPSLRTAARFAQALGISLATLLEGVDASTHL